MFFIFISFYNVFTIPVVIENARLQLALIITTGAQITVATNAIEMLPVATDKAINDLSKYSKEAIYLLSLLLISCLSLISPTIESLISLFCLA